MQKVDRSLNGISRRSRSAFGDFGTAIKRGGLLMGGFGVIAGGALAKIGIGFNAMKEQAMIAFSTMLGSGEKAKSFLDELQAFAAKTPFEFPELVRSSQRLLAMGFNAKEVLPTLTSIGDAVAGLGGGAFEIDRVVRALGQMRAKGKVQAEEMMQLTEIGIPAWKMLADALGTDVASAMAKVTKGQVDANTAIKAFTTGMDQRFGGMMDKQSRSLQGLWSTVKDTFSQAAAQITEPLFRGLKRALLGIQPVLDKFVKARGFRLKAQVVWTGIKEAARSLVNQIGTALAGKETQITGATARLEGKVELGPTMQASWETLGQKMLAGFGAAVSKSSAKVDEIIAAIVAALERNKGKLAEAGAVLLLSIFTTLMDPGFWAKHWELSLAVGLAIFGRGIGRFAGSLGKLAASALGRAGGDMVLTIAAGIERLSPRLATAFVFAMNLAIRAVGAVFGRAWGAVDATARAIWNRMGVIMQAVLKVGFIAAILRAVADAATALAQKGADLVSAAGDLGSKVWNKIKEWFSKLPGLIGGKLEETATVAGEKARGIGRAILGGILGGLLSLGSLIKQKIEAGVGWALSNLNIPGHSPPEHAAQEAIGVPLGRGAIKGWMLGSADLPTKMAEKVRDAIDAARQAIAERSGVFQSAFDNLVNNALSAFDRLHEGIKTKAEKALEAFDLKQAKAENAKRLADLKKDYEAANNAFLKLQAEGVPVLTQKEGESDEDFYERQLQAREDYNAEYERLLKDAADANTALQEERDRQRLEKQRAALEAEAAASRKHEDDKIALERYNFEKRMGILAKQYQTHQISFKEFMVRLRKIFDDNEIPWAKSSAAVGLAIAKGLYDARNDVARAADALADEIKSRFSRLVIKVRITAGYEGGDGSGGKGKGPGHAGGGLVRKDRAYPVGEGGREWFVPWTQGQIVPENPRLAVGGGSGSLTVMLANTVYLDGAKMFENTQRRALQYEKDNGRQAFSAA